MKFIKRLAYAVPALVAIASVPAHAALDLTPLTGSFTAADVITGVMAVATILAAIFVAMKAAKIVLGMLRSS